MTSMIDPPAPEKLDTVTRRRFVVGGLGLGAAILVGCGDDDDPSSASATRDGGKFPLTMKHRFGSTTIPSEPKRIVAAGFNDSDFVLALGVTPVGVANFIGEFPEERRPWAQQQLAGAKPTVVSNDEGELNFERIAALKPDVIVYYNYLEEGDYKLLAQIAPTVVEPKEGTLWPQHTIDVGRALGHEEPARGLVRDVQQQFAQARETHPAFMGTTAGIVFGYTPGATNFFLLEPSDPRFGFFDSLGFKTPRQTGEVSRERFELLDQDLVVVVGAEREAIEKDGLFRNLDAVKQGRVAYLGGFEQQFAGALGFDSPLSLPVALDVAVPLLARALA